MQITKIAFQNIPQLAAKDIAISQADTSIQPFLKYAANMDEFPHVIADKIKDNTDRELLVSVLKTQYKGVATSDKVKHNIEQLGLSNTFTLTTAHQPSLFTGPLYYIYKIISTIRLADELTTRYPDYNFVPVFVSGAEDHDFEEINHARIYGKTLEWQSNELGSVGQFSSENVLPTIDELAQILGDSDQALEIISNLRHAYTQHPTHGMATFAFVNHLFQHLGLVFLDMSAQSLKAAYRPVIKEEIFEQSSQPLVNNKQQEIIAKGFNSQAHARAINFFYLSEHGRKRIERFEGGFQVIDTPLQFTETEMDDLINQHPERFSPNVILRPLYQEWILPNLAYIGGGGELAYWLELSEVFEHFKVNYPMLIRRNSALWIDKGSQKKLDKLGISVTEIFEHEDILNKKYVAQNTTASLDLQAEIEQIEHIYQQISQKFEQISPSLVKSVQGETNRQLKAVKQLETRLIREEKKKHETALNQIKNVKEKLFPNNSLQERKDNFLPFYIKYGQSYFNHLYHALHPLEEGFVVISE